MKRPYTNHENIPIEDILLDVPQDQLAAIGAVSLSYNYAENTINRMLYLAIGMPIALFRDVVSRINGIDGKIEIVKAGAKERLNLSDEAQDFMSISLGNEGFKLLKKYRDAVIHARIVNRLTSIGELVESRGKHSEVLLSREALRGLYERLELMRRELASLYMVMDTHHWLNHLRNPDDPDSAQYEAKIPKFLALAHEYRQKRLSLPSLPEFPNEAELRAQENQASLAPPQQLTGWLDIGSLGLAEIGRASGNNPHAEEN
jgi:hypothetical protein